MDATRPPGFYCMDCMEAMRQFPDKFFDLAIVDPTYGGAAPKSGGRGTSPLDSEKKIKISRTGGKWAEKYSKKS